MDNLWILIAHQAGARIFSRNRPSQGLTLVEDIDHPEGRLKDHELISDRQGRTFGSASPHRRHAFAPSTPPHEQAAIRFATQLAQKLETARSKNLYYRLIVVAGPEEMGLLRDAMSKATLDRVVGSLNKNLGKVRDLEMEDQLLEVLSEADFQLVLQRSG